MPYSDGTFPSGAGTVRIGATYYKCNSFTATKATQTFNTVDGASAPSGALSYELPLTGTAELQFSSDSVAEPTTAADNTITGTMVATINGASAVLLITSVAINKRKDAPWTASVAWQGAVYSASPSGLPWDGVNYIYGQNGTTSTVSTPDSGYVGNMAANFSVEICCKPANTTSGVTGLFYTGGLAPNMSVRAYLTSGFLEIIFSKTGATQSNGSGGEFQVTALTDKTVYYRLSRSVGVSTGSYYFAESLDGESWTDLSGSGAVGTAGTAYDTTSPLVVGGYVNSASNACNGISRFRVWNGFNVWTGTPLLDLNPQIYAGGSTYTAANSTAGETWTLNGSAIIVSAYS